MVGGVEVIAAAGKALWFLLLLMITSIKEGKIFQVKELWAVMTVAAVGRERRKS